MRFLVDNQLRLSLARHLVELGHEADHSTDRGLEEADDRAIWQIALQEQRVVASKDEDFFSLANRVEDKGRLLWIRLGNCRKAALLSAVSKAMEQILGAYESGQRIVELG